MKQPYTGDTATTRRPSVSPVSFLLLAAAALCPGAAAAPPAVIDVETVVPVRADASSPAGVWKAGDGGALFGVRPLPGYDGSFELFIVDSPDYPELPGTVFGTMRTTGRAGVYDARLAKGIGPARGLLGQKSHNCIIELSQDCSSLVFRSYRRGKTVNILRLLPYLFRLSVTDVDTRPAGIDGARRVSPEPLPQSVTL